MFDIEITIINQYLNKNYKDDDIFLDNNVLVEKATGTKIELDDKLFDHIAIAKRKEHLKRFSRFC